MTSSWISAKAHYQCSKQPKNDLQKGIPCDKKHRMGNDMSSFGLVLDMWHPGSRHPDGYCMVPENPISFCYKLTQSLRHWNMNELIIEYILISWFDYNPRFTILVLWQSFDHFTIAETIHMNMMNIHIIRNKRAKTRLRCAYLTAHPICRSLL